MWPCSHSTQEESSHPAQQRFQDLSTSNLTTQPHPSCWVAPQVRLSCRLPLNIPTEPVPPLPPFGRVMGFGVPCLSTSQSRLSLFLCPVSLDRTCLNRAPAGLSAGWEPPSLHAQCMSAELTTQGPRGNGQRDSLLTLRALLRVSTVDLSPFLGFHKDQNPWLVGTARCRSPPGNLTQHNRRLSSDKTRQQHGLGLSLRARNRLPTRQ